MESDDYITGEQYCWAYHVKHWNYIADSQQQGEEMLGSDGSDLFARADDSDECVDEELYEDLVHAPRSTTATAASPHAWKYWVVLRCAPGLATMA